MHTVARSQRCAVSKWGECLCVCWVRERARAFMRETEAQKIINFSYRIFVFMPISALTSYATCPIYVLYVATDPLSARTHTHCTYETKNVKRYVISQPKMTLLKSMRDAKLFSVRNCCLVRTRNVYSSNFILLYSLRTRKSRQSMKMLCVCVCAGGRGTQCAHVINTWCRTANTTAYELFLSNYLTFLLLLYLPTSPSSSALVCRQCTALYASACHLRISKNVQPQNKFYIIFWDLMKQ